MKFICKVFFITWLNIAILIPSKKMISIISQYLWVLYTLQVPLKSMQLKNFYFWWQQRFRGILWNSLCYRDWRTPSSTEFHGILWICSCHRNCRSPSFMEFHEILFFYLIETFVSSKLQVLNLDRIPWNFEFPHFVNNHIQFCRMN